MTARLLIVDGTGGLGPLAEKLRNEFFDVQTIADRTLAPAAARDTGADLIAVAAQRNDRAGAWMLTRALRADPVSGHVPILLFDDAANQMERCEGLEAGADDILPQDAPMPLLLARIRALVRQKLLLDELRLREDTGLRLGLESGGETMQSQRLAGAKLVVVASDRDGDLFRALAKHAAYELNCMPPENVDVAAIEAAMPDAVVLVLADVDAGLRLAGRLRSLANLRHVPVVVAIAGGEPWKAGRAYEAGASDVVQWPAEGREIAARLSLLVRRKRHFDQLRENYRRSLDLVVRDSLTGLHNRRYLETHFANQVRHAAATGKILGLLMIDIDRFKSINDKHGHAIGDEVLRIVAERLLFGVRDYDLVARFGGEEFMVIMQNVDEAEAMKIAERLRRTVADRPFTVPGLGAAALPVTVSIGMALTQDAPTPGELFLTADEALYAAKRAGRNKVVRMPPEAHPRSGA
ncbi:MAG: diguanylate cyclase [Alphaproteobacteria bacterium]